MKLSELIVGDPIGHYSIVRVEGIYKGIPAPPSELDDLDLSVTSGVVSAQNLDDLKSQIQDIVEWSNSRGQYSGTKRVTAKNYLRVNSFSTANEQIRGKLVSAPMIIRHDGREYIPVAEESGRKTGPSVMKTLKSILFNFKFRGLSTDAIKNSLTESEIQSLKYIMRRGGFRPKLEKTDSNVAYLKYLLKGLVLWVFKNSNRVKVNDIDLAGAKLVVSQNSEPELIFAGKSENVVKYDRYYFIIPHGIPVDWSDLPSLVAFDYSQDLKELYEKLDKTFTEVDSKNVESHEVVQEKIGNKPELIKELVDFEYQIFFYEGWFIGLPKRLYGVDLATRDVINEDGVIRDVSCDVVELEIEESYADRRQ
ncbi:hypothetical protein N9M22_05580 [Litoricolaceae bacterium]|nr:hypothetical protein [Litorivicinaceae bacterium]